MQPSNKPFQFSGTPMDYFIVTIVAVVTAYIPLFGWPIAFNYTNKWIMENLTVDGRKLVYSAGYGETLKFLVVNVLLIMVTFGIYVFWFGPKTYRYITDHTTYVDSIAPAGQPVAAPAPMAAPINPVQ